MFVVVTNKILLQLTERKPAARPRRSYSAHPSISGAQLVASDTPHVASTLPSNTETVASALQSTCPWAEVRERDACDDDDTNHIWRPPYLGLINCY
jgi:hypothetical protein